MDDHRLWSPSGPRRIVPASGPDLPLQRVRARRQLPQVCAGRRGSAQPASLHSAAASAAERENAGAIDHRSRPRDRGALLTRPNTCLRDPLARHSLGMQHLCPREGAAWCSTVTCSRCLMGSADSTPISSSHPMPRRRSFSGARFCVRYVRRQTVHDFDLTADEADGLIGAGLGLMVVQHVESETAWTPTAAKGAANGDVAATEAQQIGIPPGGMVWCDLEGVTVGTPAAQVIDYCNRWHAAVAGAGYVPGLYVGFHCGLDATQLYRALRFSHYWGAYNLNADEMPIVRGLQMKQSLCKPPDAVPGHTFEFQVDTVRADALGGHPTLVARDGWRA